MKTDAASLIESVIRPIRHIGGGSTTEPPKDLVDLTQSMMGEYRGNVAGAWSFELTDGDRGGKSSKALAFAIQKAGYKIKSVGAGYVFVHQ